MSGAHRYLHVLTPSFPTRRSSDLGCHYGLEAMKKRPNGSIVNMSSMAGIGGQSSFCAYSASKAAVAGLTRSVAAHCRAQLYKIRCNSIHPDGIATPDRKSTRLNSRH